VACVLRGTIIPAAAVFDVKICAGKAGEQMRVLAPSDRQPRSGVLVRLLIVVAATVALSSMASWAAEPKPGNIVAKGQYLTWAGDCVACHTVPGGKAFAGGRSIQTPFGTIITPNITPDKDTGIGNWTDDQFYRALHLGVGKNGENLYPAFPYPWFTKVTRDDVVAIKAYLFTLPPIAAPKKPNHLAFPFDLRLGLSVWNAAFFKPGTFKPEPTKTAAINRGAYLVEGLGHCGDCHTPKNIAEAPIRGEAFAGEPIQHWFAPNITSDMREGIGGWSEAQLVTYFKTGAAPGQGTAVGPMAETVHDSLRHLTDEDLGAIAGYLKSTPPQASYAQNRPSTLTGPTPVGAGTYLSYCAFCHQLNGRGSRGDVASLVGNGLVVARGPQDVVRVILGGHLAVGNYGVMPAIGADMTDQQIADVTNYIRTAWSNRAPATAEPGMVAQIRKQTRSMLGGTNTGGCPSVEPPELAKTINDPQSGIINLMKGITDTNILQNTDQIVKRLRSDNPQATQADILNSLTLAYCPIAAPNGRLATVQSRERFNRFSELVYTQLASNGKD
jgi:mono/diheme cytochrome c family protein